MSTRGLIGHWTDKDKGQWEGAYHHWDSYPDGLGKTLYHMFHDKDINGRLQTLLGHTWSTINGKSWDMAPGFNETHECRAIIKGKKCGRPQYGKGRHDGRTKHEFTDAPNCYCHGDRSEQPWNLLTQDNASESGVEWAYIIDPDKRTITVLECTDSGQHMVGMFGHGSNGEDVFWSERAVVFVDNPEPEWEGLQS
jgi:hypothetical protein